MLDKLQSYLSNKLFKKERGITYTNRFRIKIS